MDATTASKITANVKYDLAIAEIVLSKKMWLERRGEYTYFLVTSEDEPWKRSRNWESLKKNYVKSSWKEYDSHYHILAGEKRYTLDISATQEVMNAMAKSPFAWHIESVNVDNKIKWFACLWGDTPDGGVLDFSAEADTFSLAVCRAALMKVVKSANG